MAHDRTEKPTPRRLREARRKGQLARSRDVEHAAQLVAVIAVLAWGGSWIVEALGRALRVGLERFGDAPLRTVEPLELSAAAVQTVAALGVMTLPVAGAAMVATVAAAALQGGWNVAPEALTPNWGRLSPKSGLQRLAPGRAGVELVKTLMAAVAISWLALRIVQATVDGAVYFGRVDPTSAAKLGWDHMLSLLQQSAVVLAILAAADYGVQRWRLGQSLRMTKQEVRDDSRLTEGSPEVKARLRRLQRDLLRKRMLSNVPKATVVITNPTEYAVALEYRRDLMAAPKVVAKGKGVLAARIRAIARECGVPIVENVPLAQALYKSVEVGEAIPGQLFGAVAEVLAYLIRLKQLAL